MFKCFAEWGKNSVCARHTTLANVMDILGYCSVAEKPEINVSAQGTLYTLELLEH